LWRGPRLNTDSRVVPPSEASPDQTSAESETGLENVPKAGQKKLSGSVVWLWRIRALLLVTVCATFGVLLIILPWTPKWTDNPLLLTHPVLRNLVSNGFVRGLASGLGVLDLWLGFSEAIHYHEAKESG
jgi:hypothetical protein